MKIMINCLLLLLLTNLTFAQSAKEWLTLADEKYQNKEYKASAEAFEKAFALQPPTSSALYNAACSWALAGEQNKGLDQLEKSVAAGWTNLAWMKKDSDLESLRGTTRWKTITGDLASKLKKLEETQNVPLKRELETIAEKDQRHRQKNREIGETFGWDSKEMKELWVKQNHLDSVNTVRIIEIIEEFGYPGKTMVGNQAATAFLVIQHADLAVQEKYLPVLRAAADKNELRWSSLALLIDRINIRNGKKQIYGSQVSRDPVTGKSRFSPIEEEAKVNERRAAIGLEPIEDYAKRFGFDYEAPTTKEK
ncbi:MAG: DUF6624 domain-containing protein [Saprospiraceae bacterium]